jgi:hypothetical protein
VKAYNSIADLTSSGTTILDHYRRCMRPERNYETSLL